jgi:hypothetical protein
MSQETITAAREQARVGRLEQLRLFMQFETGQETTFKVHNNEAGFKLSKASLPPTPRTSKRLKFSLSEALIDATAAGDAEQVGSSCCALFDCCCSS